jgi:putative chitinase
MSILQPTDRSEIIIDDFIQYATTHLTTISGVANTISLYPPVGTPGPGVVLWSGYTIPPTAKTVITPELDTTEIELSDEQLSVSVLATLDGLPINEATATAFDTNVAATPPIINFEEAQLIFNQSINPTPINEPTDEELNTEILNTSGITEEIPNYKTNVIVPEDIIIAMRRWGVGKTPLERAHFLAQCAHESAGFKAKVENLNYSSNGLLSVFPKYFKTLDQANEYAKKPENIASRVYGNRMGNGVESTRDGWKYKGRGYIQLTGKSNYIAAEKVIKGNIVNNPDKVETEYPGDSACFFWTSNKLKNYITDDNDTSLKKLTKRINGGDKGIVDRKRKFIMYWNELQKDPKLWS